MKKIIAMAFLALGMFAALPASADVVDVAGEYYVDTADASVWDETNGQPGLQRDGLAPDTRVA